MTKDRPGDHGSKSKVTPPAERRTARQQRLAGRDSNRALGKASTSGGGDKKPVMLISGLFLIVAILVIGAAYIATRPKDISTDSLTTPGAALVTPASIPTSGRTLGDPNAPVTLQLWSDFRCSGCWQFVSEREPLLVTNYVQTGKLKIEYVDFLTIDGNDGATASRDAANAAWCAADQGKFWPMHDWLFANQLPNENPNAFTIARLLVIGKAAGVDTAKFNPCVQNGSHLADIAAEKVPSDAGFTPATYIKGVQILGAPDPSTGSPTPASYADLAAAIDLTIKTGHPLASGSPAASTAPSPSPSY